MKYKRETAVFGLALALRAVYLWQWSSTPYYLVPQLDDQVHQWWALDILQGRFLRPNGFYSAPLYPYLMALVYRVCGAHPALILWLQALLGAAACVILQRLAARIEGPGAGLAAGIAAALYLPFLYYSGFLLKETLVVFLLAAFALQTLRALESRAFSSMLGCGFFLGLAGLARGASALILAPVVLAGLAVWMKADFRRLAAAFILGLSAAVAPAALHNAAAAKDFIPVSAGNGFAFFIGNREGASGTMRYPPGFDSHPYLEERQSAAAAESAAGRPLKPSQVSRYWYGQALDFIAAEPAAWARLTLRKLLLFWNWFELPDDYNMHFIIRHSKTALSWPLLSYRWAATWGLIGMVLAFKKREARLLALMGAAYLLSVVVTIVTDRYRLPIVVFLIPFAGIFAGRLLAIGDWRGFRELGRAALWAAPLWSLCHLPLLAYTADDEAQGWARLEGIYYDRGEYQNALAAFGKALEARPESVGEAGFLAAGQAAEKLGDRSGALAAYREGLRRYPESAALSRALAP